MSHGKAVLISLAVAIAAFALVVRTPLKTIVFPAGWTPSS